jgi:SAM-dependent methyltransferase
MPSNPPSAEYFDAWYRDKTDTPEVDEVHRRVLGLPPTVPSGSSVPGDGIAEVADELRLAAGHVLLDLACGRGGYGLEVAARTSARLIGVDFSAEALRHATDLASSLGRPAEFRVGDLSATGLDDSSVDSVMCLDSVQFADPQDTAYREIRRVLRPGGRVVLTCWEPLSHGDERLARRLRMVDLGAGLERAGFADIQVTERPEWRARERLMWEEAVALDPGDNPALRSFHDEGIRSLETWDLVRRVLATATAP